MTRIAVPLEKAYRLHNHGPTVLVSAAHDGHVNVMAAAWNMPLDFTPPKVAGPGPAPAPRPAVAPPVAPPPPHEPLAEKPPAKMVAGAVAVVLVILAAILAFILYYAL